MYILHSAPDKTGAVFVYRRRTSQSKSVRLAGSDLLLINTTNIVKYRQICSLHFLHKFYLPSRESEGKIDFDVSEV
jgi:hypothetical protein